MTAWQTSHRNAGRGQLPGPSVAEVVVRWPPMRRFPLDYAAPSERPPFTTPVWGKVLITAGVLLLMLVGVAYVWFLNSGNLNIDDPYP